MTGKILNAMIDYNDPDTRRVTHSLKVYGYAKAIGAAEGLDESTQLNLEVAAILHDIGIKLSEEKYGSSAAKYQELEGPPVAREILTAAGVEEGIIDRVCFLVGHHHTYPAIDGPDFQILVEADFLVNAYEEGMSPQAARTASEKLFKTAAGKRMLAALIRGL